MREKIIGIFFLTKAKGEGFLSKIRERWREIWEEECSQDPHILNISKSTATCRISQLQTLISTIKLVEKYETANWSLRQGDDEVNKRIKQKLYI